MSPTFEIVASGAFGVLAGVLSGFLGIGGGGILAPLLVVTLGIEQHRAQGISLAALLPPVGLPAVLAFRRAGVQIRTSLVIALIVGFLFGALGGAWLAHRVASRELRWGFALFLAVSAVHSVLAKAVDRQGNSQSTRPWTGVPIGIAAGLMSGLLGVGGGLVALPLLKRFNGLSRLEAQATTLAMMLPPIGLPAVYVYAQEQGGLPWALLAAVAVGFALGAGLGARMAGRVHARVATFVYAGVLAILALILVRQ